MDKVSVMTVDLLTVITLAVIVAALFFLPDVIPLHFGPTGRGHRREQVLPPTVRPRACPHLRCRAPQVEEG